MSKPATISSLFREHCTHSEELRAALTEIYTRMTYRLSDFIVMQIADYIVDKKRDDWVPRLGFGQNLVYMGINKRNLRGFSFYDNMFSRTIYDRRDLIIPGVIEPTKAITRRPGKPGDDMVVRSLVNPDIYIEFDPNESSFMRHEYDRYECNNDCEDILYAGVLTVHGEKYCVKIIEHYTYASVSYYCSYRSRMASDVREKVGYYLCEFV